MKKTLAFGIVLLFIGVAFAPSFYADVESDNSTRNSGIEITNISYGIYSVIATIRNNGLTDAETDVLFLYSSLYPGGVITIPMPFGRYRNVTIPAGDRIKVTQFFSFGLGRKIFSVEVDGDSLNSVAFCFFFIGLEIKQF